MILVCDLRPQIQAIRAELDEAWNRVLNRGRFILDEEGRAFESEFAAFLEAKQSWGVASGTDAIQLALRALGVGPGDRVLTAPNTANPTCCAISVIGAVPMFADIDLASGQLDPARVEAVLAALPARDRPKALLPVHLYGSAAPLDDFLRLGERFGIPLVEDAAQAHGTRSGGRAVGTIGRLAAFSFYPSKNLGAYGDGGAVSTNDPELGERVRLLRNYGQRDRYEHTTFGVNSRLDELQAAILRVKLRHLPAWNERRRELAGRYREALAGLPLALPPDDTKGDRSIYHLFVVRVARRERFRDALRAREIATEIHYPTPIHLQPAYASLGLGPGTYPAAERRAAQIVSLPLYPELTDPEFQQVVEAIRDVMKGEPHPDEVGS